LIERQAFAFGAALLLPERKFLQDLYSISLDSLRTQKSRWRVSVAMMIEWLKNKGIIDHDQHKRLRINYSIRKWNRSEPLDTELPIEQPTFIAKAVSLVVGEKLQAADQIVANTGFNKEWLQKLLDISAASLASPGGPELKATQTKRGGIISFPG
jgi:Zn-dependent peptidase ImmA (M78 family)